MKPLRILFILVLSTLSILAFAQKADKPTDIAASEKVQKRVELYKTLYNHHIEKDPAKAHSYILTALELATDLGNKSLEEQLYNFMGRGYEAKGNYSLAIEYYLKSLSVLKQENAFGGQIFCLNDIGNCYYAIEKFDKALEYYQQGIALAKQHPDQKMAYAVSLNNQGLVLYQNKEYYKALENHKQAYQYRIESKEPSTWAHSCITIGNDYTKLGVVDSAEFYYAEAYRFCSIDRDSIQLAKVWRLQGEMYASFNKFQKSDSTLQLAANYFISNKAYMPLAKMYLSLADISIEKKQYPKAESFYKKVIEFASLGETDAILGHAYEGLIKLYNQSGQGGRVIDYYQKLLVLKDTLLTSQMHQAFELASSQDEIFKLDNQIAEAKLSKSKTDGLLKVQESKLNAFVVISIIGVVFALLLIALIIYLRFQNRKLKVATIDAQSALKAKSDFFSNMSHEIRTPMNGIVGFSELLLSEKLSEKEREFAQSIKFSADNLMVIINDILDLSKIDSGKLNLEITDFNLHELIREISRNYQIQSKAKGLHFDLEMEKTIPVIIKGDTVRIFQILGNLLNNALKFTNEGTILFKIYMSADKQKLFFSIKDTGIGISADKQKYIFEKFTQAEENITRIFGGSGLGLAIAKKMAELMGGDISLESKTAQGSEFTFYITNFASEKSNVVSIDTPLSTPDKSKLVTMHPAKQLKVLSVDDNSVNQKIVTLFMKSAGYEVDLAMNGFEALEKLELNDYAIILMDFHMPEMDGFETTRRIRKHDNKQKATLKIIGLSADVFENSRIMAMDAGMDAILHKPIKKEDLYNLVAELTNKANEEKLAS